MDNSSGQHTVKYSLYVKVLLVLLLLTAITVGITSIELRTYTVIAAMVIAGTKATLVLIYFMHLKFDKKIFTVMIGGVLFVFTVLIIITFLDYYFR